MRPHLATVGETEAEVGGAGLGDIRDNLAYWGHLLDTSCTEVSTAVFGGTGSRIRSLEPALPLAHRGTPILKIKRLKFRDKNDFIRDTRLDWQGQYGS